MASLPIFTIIEQSQVSPPPTTIVTGKSLPLNFIDIVWVLKPPLHYLFFYEIPKITKTHFIETIISNLKHSLSITLQHFFPFVGNLIVYSTCPKKSEIRSVEGDCVNVTFGESNLDFYHLTGNYPRNCDEFYHLISRLGHVAKVSDYVKIPVFSLKVTLFPNCGISIGLTSHHSLGDLRTIFSFLKAWTSITRCGNTDESFLANGDVPFYERVVKYPVELEESFFKRANFQTLINNNNYIPPYLSSPTDKVRATFILNQTIINRFKKRVSTKFPTLQHVSSFTVACAYLWCCIIKLHNDNKLQRFVIPIDCRVRLDPPVPSTYFGNCLTVCNVYANDDSLKENEGVINAAKIIGEKLHKVLTNKNGIFGKLDDDRVYEGLETTVSGITGSPNLKFYDLDFGWGKPKKLETIWLDYVDGISINASKQGEKDFEIEVCLKVNEMQHFVQIFNQGLEPFV